MAAILVCVAALTFAEGRTGTGQAPGRTGGQGADTSSGSAEAGKHDGQRGAGGSTDATESSGSERSGRSQGTQAESGDSSASFVDWVMASADAADLGLYRARVASVAAAALWAGVPADAFKARIREAVAKGADPALAAKGIEDDAARWTWLAGTLRGLGWPPESAATGFYLSAASAMRNGIGEGVVREVSSWAAKNGSSAGRAGAALTTAAALVTRFGPAEAVSGASSPLEAAAMILVKSRLRVGQFEAIAEIGAKARSSGLSPIRFLAALEETIAKGGGIAELQAALKS